MKKIVAIFLVFLGSLWAEDPVIDVVNSVLNLHYIFDINFANANAS